MTTWYPPPGTAGDATLIRASSVAVREDPRDCPSAKSTALRPLLLPDPEPPRPRKAMEDFGLAPFMAAADLMEHQNWPLDRVIEKLRRTEGGFGSHRAPAHPGLLEWTARHLPVYLVAREASALVPSGSPGTVTVPEAYEWVAQHRHGSGTPDSRGATHYEQTAWGRRYVSADGRYRDLWLPSIGRARTDRPEAELAAVAQVLAQGLIGPRAPFGKHFRPTAQQPPLPERVRVFGFGFADEATLLLLDWDQEEVQRQYHAHSVPALARAVTGSTTNPGTSCLKCTAVSGCAALPRTPGLWGGTPTAVPRRRRSLAAWDLRLYKECPAQYHLTRELRLTALRTDSDASVRGRLVDARLNEQHDPARPRPVRGCREIPGPVDPGNWSAGRHALSGRHAREAAAMLARHAALCPLDGMAEGEQVLVQHEVSCYVPELEVVVFATPDLLYSRAGGWIWRETKTSTSRLWENEPLMQRYPQLALAVLLTAAGALGGGLRRSRVELELLHPDGDNRLVLDPNRPEVVEEARRTVAALAEPLLHDTDYLPAPGKHCHGCNALDWCRDGSAWTTDNALPALTGGTGAQQS